MGEGGRVLRRPPFFLRSTFFIVRRGDAAVLVSAIEAQHPDPFRTVPRETLHQSAAGVDAFEPDNRSVVVVELMRLVALLGARNGHTAIHPLGEYPSALHAFPLWLYEFDDGVFVVAAEDRDLVGTELIAINGLDVDDVLAAVTPLIAYDNEWTIRARRPTFLVSASVLNGLGLIADPRQATFRLRARNGAVLEPTLDATTRDVVSPFASNGNRHWANVTANGHAVHVAYNVTRGDVTDFAREVEALARSRASRSSSWTSDATAAATTARTSHSWRRSSASTARSA
jgi:hypothetical protein